MSRLFIVHIEGVFKMFPDLGGSVRWEHYEEQLLLKTLLLKTLTKHT